MSILKWQVISYSSFASLFIAMTHNSSVNFKLLYFLLCVKGSYQSLIFETFKCSGENLPYSLYHFPNHKSVFVQILHQSSMSWKITLPTCLGQTLYVLHKRNKSKWKFSEFQVLRSKFTKFLSFLKKQISFLSNFAALFGVMRHNSSILFLAKIFRKSDLRLTLLHRLCPSIHKALKMQWAFTLLFQYCQQNAIFPDNFSLRTCSNDL